MRSLDYTVWISADIIQFNLNRCEWIKCKRLRLLRRSNSIAPVQHTFSSIGFCIIYLHVERKTDFFSRHTIHQKKDTHFRRRVFKYEQRNRNGLTFGCAFGRRKFKIFARKIRTRDKHGFSKKKHKHGIAMAVKWNSSATTICALCILVLSNEFADGVRVVQQKRVKPIKGECKILLEVWRLNVWRLTELVNACRPKITD